MDVNVDIQWTWPDDRKTGVRGANLRISDRESNVTLIDVALTAGQVTAMLSSLHVADVPARITKPEYRDRIGKRMVNAEYARERHYGNDLTEEMHDTGERALSEGWDTAEWRRTNQGWVLIVRKWVEVGDAS